MNQRNAPAAALPSTSIPREPRQSRYVNVENLARMLTGAPQAT
jgi:hypothetical protein